MIIQKITRFNECLIYVLCCVMFFKGIAALNPDKDPVKEKHPNPFRSLVKLYCVSPGSKYFPKESEDRKLAWSVIRAAGC